MITFYHKHATTPMDTTMFTDLELIALRHDMIRFPEDKVHVDAIDTELRRRDKTRVKQ